MEGQAIGIHSTVSDAGINSNINRSNSESTNINHRNGYQLQKKALKLQQHANQNEWHESVFINMCMCEQSIHILCNMFCLPSLFVLIFVMCECVCVCVLGWSKKSSLKIHKSAAWIAETDWGKTALIPIEFKLEMRILVLEISLNRLRRFVSVDWKENLPD